VPELRNRDELWERLLSLAQKGWGQTHPNPMVGALIVEDGEVVAEGYHQRAGGGHAETVALNALGRKPQKNAVLFVSLEPCSTHGRTPPCTGAIDQSGIKHVLVGCSDPNPEHSGRGLKILEKAGIEVTLAPKNFQVRFTRLNFIFNHQIMTGEPLIALKIAATANGMVAERAGYPSRVTEAEARADMMNWRRLFPAICVGSGTVLADNPSLTARKGRETWCPIRLVLDSTLSTLAPEVTPRKLYSDQFADHTIIVTASGLKNSLQVQRAEKLGVQLVEGELDTEGQLLPQSLRTVLKKLELNSVYCEGGPTLARSLLEAGEIDYLFRYRSPKAFDQPDALAAPELDQYPINEPIEQILATDRLNHGFL
jgi:diaminohydroxyphosphoribosylaminopyrimidine deaminase/5-amino-6-(5-phosphoribosylamino)uracil reductase